VEEDAVDDFLVVEGDVGNLLGEGEDHVEVLGGQQFGSAVLEPVFARQALALGAVADPEGTPAGAVLNVSVLAVAAPFDAAAQFRRTAGFTGVHQTVLMQRQRVSLPVRWAILSKDVGPLQSWLGQGLRLAFAFAAPSGVAIQLVERADCGRHGTAETDRIARVIERDLEFLPDSRDVHDCWRRLLVAHEVKGVQVHDARLAASMYVHGVTQLLTLSVRDFQMSAGSTPPNSSTAARWPLLKSGR